MLTPLALLKFPITYLNSPTGKKPYQYAKNVSISYTELTSAQFWLILSKFDCHGNFLCSPQIPDSIFEFADPENPTIYEKDFTISYIELKSVQFCLICLNLVAMATPSPSLKF